MSSTATPSDAIPPVVSPGTGTRSLVTQGTANSERRPDVSFHVAMLATAAVVVALSCVLRVADGQRVMIPIIDCPLPGVCTYRRWFGIECPGCGLTRCFISMAHFDPVVAWSFNPAGVLGFALVALQIPYRGLQLWRVRSGRREFRLGWLGQSLFWLFFAMLMVQWLQRTFM